MQSVITKRKEAELTDGDLGGFTGLCHIKRKGRVKGTAWLMKTIVGIYADYIAQHHHVSRDGERGKFRHFCDFVHKWHSRQYGLRQIAEAALADLIVTVRTSAASSHKVQVRRPRWPVTTLLVPPTVDACALQPIWQAYGETPLGARRDSRFERTAQARRASSSAVCRCSAPLSRFCRGRKSSAPWSIWTSTSTLCATSRAASRCRHCFPSTTVSTLARCADCASEVHVQHEALSACR